MTSNCSELHKDALHSGNGHEVEMFLGSFSIMFRILSVQIVWNQNEQQADSIQSPLLRESDLFRLRSVRRSGHLRYKWPDSKTSHLHSVAFIIQLHSYTVLLKLLVLHFSFSLNWKHQLWQRKVGSEEQKNHREPLSHEPTYSVCAIFFRFCRNYSKYKW